MSDRSGATDPRLRAFGARVRQIREDRGLTLEGLAHEAGVGVRQLSRVEAGKASPSLVWLLDLSAPLGVSVTELLKDV